MAPTSKEPMGLYPNLKTHRIKLGLSVPELLGLVQNAPSDKSVRRLENGKPIRLTTVNKLFNAISAANGTEPMVRENEIIVVER